MVECLNEEKEMSLSGLSMVIETVGVFFKKQKKKNIQLKRKMGEYDS